MVALVASVALVQVASSAAAVRAAAAQDAASAAAVAPSASTAVQSAIVNFAIVNAPVKDVWAAWVSSQGVASWLAPAAEVDGRPGGVFRAIYFAQATRPIDRGNDGHIIAMQPEKFLSLTWMTPIHMASLKGNSTVVLVYFTALPADQTRVDLINTGYGDSADWQAAYAYNVKGWDRILSGLEYRFEHGPVDWAARTEEFRKTGSISYWRELKQSKAQ